MGFPTATGDEVYDPSKGQTMPIDGSPPGMANKGYKIVPTPVDAAEEAQRRDYRKANFRQELEVLINRCSMENGSNTPDFILAQYLMDALEAYDKAAVARTKHFTD